MNRRFNVPSAVSETYLVSITQVPLEQLSMSNSFTDDFFAGLFSIYSVFPNSYTPDVFKRKNSLILFRASYRSNLKTIGFSASVVTHLDHAIRIWGIFILSMLPKLGLDKLEWVWEWFGLFYAKICCLSVRLSLLKESLPIWGSCFTHGDSDCSCFLIWGNWLYIYQFKLVIHIH